MRAGERGASRGAGAGALVLWAVVGAAGCGYSESAMRVQREQNAALHAQQERSARALAELRERNAALAESVRELGGNVDALTEDREQLREDLAASEERTRSLQHDREALRSSLAEAHRALDELRAREAQARERATQFRALLERFRAMIDAGDLSVRVLRNRMVISLPEGVLFDTGRAEVKPRGRAVLTRVGEVLRTLPRDFQVAGHTDNVPIRTPRFASNWELSTARATAVAHLLIEQGMPAERLSAAGYADTQPVAANDTPASRQQNRRTELVLLPLLSELPDLSSLVEAPAPAPAAPAPAAPAP